MKHGKLNMCTVLLVTETNHALLLEQQMMKLFLSQLLLVSSKLLVIMSKDFSVVLKNKRTNQNTLTTSQHTRMILQHCLLLIPKEEILFALENVEQNLPFIFGIQPLWSQSVNLVQVDPQRVSELQLLVHAADMQLLLIKATITT